MKTSVQTDLIIIDDCQHHINLELFFLELTKHSNN
jgi:hypothetical protein